MKRIISVLILFWLVCLYILCETPTILPTNYYEIDAGTEENPYLISNLGNLRWLSETREIWGSEETRYHFQQTAEIDAT